MLLFCKRFQGCLCYPSHIDLIVDQRIELKQECKQVNPRACLKLSAVDWLAFLPSTRVLEERDIVKGCLLLCLFCSLPFHLLLLNSVTQSRCGITPSLVLHYEAQQGDVTSKDCSVDVTSCNVGASIDVKRALGPQREWKFDADFRFRLTRTHNYSTAVLKHEWMAWREWCDLLTSRSWFIRRFIRRFLVARLHKKTSSLQGKQSRKPLALLGIITIRVKLYLS